MGKADYYADGQWNCICDQCGKKFKSGQMRKQWDGLIVCRKCHDPRHPQDYVRGTKDVQTVPFTRPEAEYSFTDEATAMSLWDDDAVAAALEPDPTPDPEPPPANTNIFSFTSTGTPAGLSYLSVGNTADTYYLVGITSAGISFYVVEGGATSFFDETLDGLIEGDITVEHDGVDVFVTLEGTTILTTTLYDLSPYSQQDLAESAPHTITNIVIG